jgi:hypothetical protein
MDGLDVIKLIDEAALYFEPPSEPNVTREGGSRRRATLPKRSKPAKRRSLIQTSRSLVTGRNTSNSDRDLPSDSGEESSESEGMDGRLSPPVEMDRLR